MQDLVHKCRGRHCAYVLRCAGDERYPYYIYCGHTSDIEVRVMAHACGRGAMFCKEHPPEELIGLTVHETLEAAVIAEVANCNLYHGRRGNYFQTEGGRLNMVGDPPYPPRGWKNLHPEEKDGEEDAPAALH